MKLSALDWEVSFVAELLAGFVFVDDEFCANVEFVVANAIKMRVIARAFVWFTGFLSVRVKRSWARMLPGLSSAWIYQHVGFQLRGLTVSEKSRFSSCRWHELTGSWPESCVTLCQMSCVTASELHHPIQFIPTLNPYFFDDNSMKLETFRL